ncbi:MAG: HAD-IA family hydrolase [Cyanobacteria bacterium J06650_10]
MPNAILFGSIGTIADTSELQRKAFNQAFDQHNLDWNWSREAYQTLLSKSGGQKRIENYAQAQGQSVDAAAIHKTKSELFQTFMKEGKLQPRPGVTDIIEKAKSAGMDIAFVTTTSAQNVSSMLKALENSLPTNSFNVVINGAVVPRGKPEKDAYCHILNQLGQKADSCIAIEDNVDGVKAAVAADITCLAFPNQNTVHHDFSQAQKKIGSLDFDQIKSLLQS